MEYEKTMWTSDDRGKGIENSLVAYSFSGYAASDHAYAIPNPAGHVAFVGLGMWLWMLQLN